VGTDPNNTSFVAPRPTEERYGYTSAWVLPTRLRMLYFQTTARPERVVDILRVDGAPVVFLGGDMARLLRLDQRYIAQYQ
jgi:hypothetical protein